jgi:two-component sensor histidine kinase
VLSSVVDITERKRADEERTQFVEKLQTSNSQLEEQVRNRTAELSRTLKEREVLLQEVHHRDKNNLQIISSLISLQARNLEHGAGRDALEECQGRIQVIALIHEKLYQSQDYANIPFSAYARALAENVFHATNASSQNVLLDLEIQDCAIAVDKAIPCGLILNELISNARRHGFCDGRSGKIRVELEKAEGHSLRLTVRDNGMGFPSGFDVAKGGSLGLQLVRMLVRQIDAKLNVETENGTCFKLELQWRSKTSNQGSHSVLIVEDESVVAYDIQQTLASFG